MTVHSGTHPSADVLRAFGLGKLDDGTSGAVMAHVEQCDSCRKEVAALTNDDFLSRLRQAQGREQTAASGQTFAESRPSAKPPLGPTSLFNLPPELADHPDYEVLRELGRGGMGVVYLAKHRLSGRQEVLKVMNKALISHADSRERFMREIQSAARLDHKNVVKMYTALERGELMVLVMEYVPGEDLAQVVKSRGWLPVSNACYYVQQAAAGLQHAHEKGMVHRDIKPQNLILAREGKKHTVKILDFGLAKAMHSDDVNTGLTSTGAMMGTPAYMAPEQSVDAASADIRADVYSLGCTLYHLLAGDPPFSGRSLFEVVQAHHSKEAQPLHVVRTEVSKDLAVVVARMMAKDPAKRYQTPAEVVKALEPFVKGSLKPLSPPPKENPGDAAIPVLAPATLTGGRDTVAKEPARTVPPKPTPPKREQGDTVARLLMQETVLPPVLPSDDAGKPHGSAPRSVRRSRAPSTLTENSSPRSSWKGCLIGIAALFAVSSVLLCAGGWAMWRWATNKPDVVVVEDDPWPATSRGSTSKSSVRSPTTARFPSSARSTDKGNDHLPPVAGGAGDDDEIKRDVAALKRVMKSGNGSASYVKARGEERAWRWRRAAESGSSWGQFLYGRALELGAGVPKNLEEAVRWYRKAAEQEIAYAQCELGLCYQYGAGVAKDEAEAVKWYRKAAEQDNATAQYQLGFCYAKGTGVAKDEVEAVRWYRKAAEQGHASAQNNVGVSYDAGTGVAKDEAEAVKWYRKAAEQGSAMAQYNLGRSYAEGTGVAKDEAEAVKWYRKAAEQENVHAQYKLGNCYEFGRGVVKNVAEAVKWYRKAADQGHALARNKLAAKSKK